MSLRTEGRTGYHFSPFDTHKRETPADASPEALAAQTAAYLARGGQITQVASGLTGYDYSNNPNKARASAGGKKGSAARTGLAERKKMKIRMEEGL